MRFGGIGDVLFGSLIFLNLPLVATKLAWKDTKFLFAFGDSYTTDGFNISAGIDSPVPNFTSANGPIWVQVLGEKYNLTDMRVFNLASGGATIDAALVPPFEPTVLSIVDQVQQFKVFLSKKPPGARWDSFNSLFAFWIGINDVGNSAGWTNITRPEFYETIVDRLITQLRAALTNFQHKNEGIVESMTLFDTQPLFNALLDHADSLGYVNVTGWCTAYENGIGGFGRNAQVEECAPVASYFWLNSLHPLFTIHDILAKAISTKLST